MPGTSDSGGCGVWGVEAAGDAGDVGQRRLRCLGRRGGRRCRGCRTGCGFAGKAAGGVLARMRELAARAARVEGPKATRAMDRCGAGDRPVGAVALGASRRPAGRDGAGRTARRKAAGREAAVVRLLSGAPAEAARDARGRRTGCGFAGKAAGGGLARMWELADRAAARRRAKGHAGDGRMRRRRSASGGCGAWSVEAAREAGMSDRLRLCRQGGVRRFGADPGVGGPGRGTSKGQRPRGRWADAAQAVGQ